MSKKLKSVENGLKHQQTILESDLVGFGGDWDGVERSDFFWDFCDFWVFLRYF